MHFFFTSHGKDLLDIVHQKALASNFDRAKTALTCSKLKLSVYTEVNTEKSNASVVDKADLHITDLLKANLHLAIEIIFSRHKLTKEYGDNSWYKNGFFTKLSLEQSSRPEIAKSHADKFSSCNHVLEISTGLGFDTAEIAKIAKQVTTVEINETTAEFARKNFEIQGLKNINVITADFDQIKNSLDLSKFDGLWADPSRKTIGGEKIKDPEKYHPSLSSILAISIHGIKGIKLSPGVDFNMDLDKLRTGFNREWLGFKDECVDQVIWNTEKIKDGKIKDRKIKDGTTTIIDCARNKPASIETFIPLLDINSEQYEYIDLDNLKTKLDSREPTYLIEPHSALIRSGKLNNYYLQNKILLLDSKIAYGITFADPVKTRFLDFYKIIDFLPYHAKQVNKKLSELGWGQQTIIKKRGFPKEPEQIAKDLKFVKDSSVYGVLVLTRIGSKHFVFFTKISE